jgi:hypothetical protein
MPATTSQPTQGWTALKEKAMTRIVIIVGGGLIQDIYSTDSDIEVVSVDWDCEGTDADDLVQFTDVEGKECQAFVCLQTVLPFEKLEGTDALAAVTESGLFDADG